MSRDAATQRQVDAANPHNSTWLFANAGSGKTRVLTDRVARLLLESVAPENILCLTYTKAAAAEMQNRLFKRLGNWAMMSDDLLRSDLIQLGVDHDIDTDALRQARRLFASAIEAPGGLKIQTIHSFCASILRRFPLEAGVSPQFQEIEDQMARQLRGEVVDEMLQTNDADIVKKFLKYYTGADLDSITREIYGNRAYFIRGISEDDIKETLGLLSNATRDDALKIAFVGHEKIVADAVFDVFTSESKIYKKFAEKLQSIDYTEPDYSDLEMLFSMFLYSGTANSKSVNFPQSNHTKAVIAMEPIADEMHDWMDRVAAAQEHLWAMDAVERTNAIYAFGSLFISAYEAKKAKLGMLDFDDLIRKAKELLTDKQVTAWVLFRLDGGIDHVLVDEAQDTSPIQWSVIERLTQEFAAGESARPDKNRTIFVVGDKKQSIYSFQGADPAAFDAMRHHFKTSHKAVNKPFEQTSLDHSFRSSQAILSVVDQTFQKRNMGDDLTHIAFKSDMPGRVDLWPVIEKSEIKDDRNWYDPVDQQSETDHIVQMANRVAAQIKRIIKDETLPEEIENSGEFKRRKITEGDFLILVQKRSDLFSEIIRACKKTGLEIAGADRLRVGAELAVKDITAILQFLALPEDDLSLACALKSPIFGWTEQDLFSLAHKRPEKKFLWSALRESDHHDTLRVLQDLRRQADFLRPYDLIERILTRHNGRKNLLSRLGDEAEDGIDALLSQALSYESMGVPSLTGFLNWVETDDPVIKRQMDAQGDRIRVMTVHGAKGLESPIVILPDTAKRPIRVNAELLPAGDHLIWKTTTKESATPVTALREKVIQDQQEERQRLLYVAMTRAEKWLIIGAAGDIGEEEESWYNIASAGIDGTGNNEVNLGDIIIRRVSHLDWDNLPLADQEPYADIQVEIPEFSALPEVKERLTISPSNLPGEKTLPGEGGDELAAQRGELIHLLLEHLPKTPADQRVKVGRQIAQNTDFPNDICSEIIHEITTLIANPKLSKVWDDNALTEVSLTADLPDGQRIHGAIDRLIVFDDLVLAIDYKSNRIVPDNSSQIPIGLVRQMAAYMTALKQIYPEKVVEVAILWTETGNLMTLPADLLQHALDSVSVA